MKLDLYSAHCEKLAPEALRHRSHSFYAANTPHLPLPRKHSPDGATNDIDNSRLFAAYYSFIDPKRMKGWVGLVSWPTVYRFIHINGYPSAAGQVQARESSMVRDRRSTTELHHYCILNYYYRPISSFFSTRNTHNNTWECTKLNGTKWIGWKKRVKLSVSSTANHYKKNYDKTIGNY